MCKLGTLNISQKWKVSRVGAMTGDACDGALPARKRPHLFAPCADSTLPDPFEHSESLRFVPPIQKIRERHETPSIPHYEQRSMHTDELGMIGELVERARGRVLSYKTANAAMQQDTQILRDQIARAGVKLAEKDASIDRAFESASGMRSVVDSLRKRVGEMSAIKSEVEDRVTSMGMVLSSLHSMKGAIAHMIADLQASLRDATGAKTAAETEMETIKSAAEEQAKALQQNISNLTDELALAREEIAAHAQSITDLSDALEESRAESIALRKEKVAHEEQSKTSIDEMRNCAMSLVTNVAKMLGCREPPTLGDGSHSALSIALDDVLAEHRSRAADDRDELESTIGCIRLECDAVNHQLAASNDKVIQHEAEIAKLKDENGTLSETLKRYDKRIMEQQQQLGAACAQQADMQRLRVIANTVASVLCMDKEICTVDYEDMQTLLEERVSHTACNARERNLSKERDTIRERVQGLEAEVMVLQRKLSDSEKAQHSKLSKTTRPDSRVIVSSQRRASALPRALAPRGRMNTPTHAPMRRAPISSVAARVGTIDDAIASQLGQSSAPSRSPRCADSNDVLVSPTQRGSIDPAASEADLWAVFARP